MEQNNKLLLFQESKIRRFWNKDEWYFNVVDIIEILTGSSNPRNYWKVLKSRLTKKEGYTQLVTDCNQLKFEAADGKFYLMDAVNTRTILRIIQSVPSPKAEPFKQWLAQVGQERIEEIENPELGIERVYCTVLFF